MIQIKSLFAGKNNIRDLEKELSMTVPDGERAMQVHEKRPERDGFEAVKYSRARKPGMQIVVISGWQRGQKTDHLAVAQHVGADVTLRKPFRLSELLEQLQNWIPRK